MHEVIFLMSAGVRLREFWDSSRPLSSSFDMFWKPALSGGVKNGLKVLMANSSGVLVSIPLVMFVAMSVWMIKLSLLCQRLTSWAAVAPFFVLISWSRRSEGSSGTVLPSGEVAKRMAC